MPGWPNRNPWRRHSCSCRTTCSAPLAGGLTTSPRATRALGRPRPSARLPTPCATTVPSCPWPCRVRWQPMLPRRWPRRRRTKTARRRPPTGTMGRRTLLLQSLPTWLRRSSTCCCPTRTSPRHLPIRSCPPKSVRQTLLRPSLPTSSSRKTSISLPSRRPWKPSWPRRPHWTKQTQNLSSTWSCRTGLRAPRPRPRTAIGSTPRRA